MVTDHEDGARSAGAQDEGDHEVQREGRVVGHVQRFTMGAGQFGTTWVAVSGSGARRTGFQTREAAVDWLLALDEG
jgi:hypothetical protein